MFLEMENSSGDIDANSTFADQPQNSLISSVVMFSLSIFGVFGNVLSIAVFTRPIMQSSINILLTALSVVDLLVVVLGLPVLFLPTFAAAMQLQNLIGLYSYIVILLYPILMICQTASLWLVVLINVERFAAICRPFLVNKWFTLRNTRFMLFCLTSVAVLYNTVRFWEFRLDETAGVVQLLRSNVVYYHVYYTILYEITHFLLPFISIIILNGYLLREIAKSNSIRSTLSKRETTQRKTTQMIILVTSIFGFCNILPFALNIWEAFDYDAFWSQNPSLLALVIVDLSNILVIFHSSTTFLVYLAYCSKYRRICLYFLSLRKFDTSFRSTYSFISNYRANTTNNFCNYNYNEILLSKMSSFRTVYRAGSSPCSTPSLPLTPKVCWSRNENIRVKVVKSNFVMAASNNTRQGSILKKVERKRSCSL